MWYYGRRIRIEPDWNVKASRSISACFTASIRIEPDWNVKCKHGVCKGFYFTIRIEPDWNVKVIAPIVALSDNPY